MDREKIKLQNDYLMLLEELEIQIINIDGTFENKSIYNKNMDEELIKYLKNIRNIGERKEYKNISYEVVNEKNEKLDSISSCLLKELKNGIEKYIKEVEIKIESL